jgi:hypothetical protein
MITGTTDLPTPDGIGNIRISSQVKLFIQIEAAVGIPLIIAVIRIIAVIGIVAIAVDPSATYNSAIPF